MFTHKRLLALLQLVMCSVEQTMPQTRHEKLACSAEHCHVPRMLWQRNNVGQRQVRSKLDPNTTSAPDLKHKTRTLVSADTSLTSAVAIQI